MRTMIAVTIAALMLASGCDNKGSGGGVTSKSAGIAPPPAAEPAPAPAPPPEPTAKGPSTAPAQAAPEAQKVEIQLSTVGNTMTFDKTSLSVPTGAEVHLTLKNNSTMDTLPHNWALVKTGTEAKVALAGLEKAADAGYIFETEDMIAHTPLAAPGKTVEVTFTAPAPGKYPYICTVPGHYMMMKGVLTVTP